MSFVCYFIPMDARKENIKQEKKLKYKWDNRRILIVEDIEVNHKLIDSILRKKTHADIVWAMNGQEAVNIVKENNDIDLVLMDIRLPVMSGYQATREIRKICNDIPIIAQTAYVMEDEKDKVLDVGCDDLVTKPLRKKLLLEKIASFFNKN